MARVYTLQPIPGVKDLLTLLDFLGNTDRYEERLTEMVALHDEINAIVEKVGEAEAITSLRSQAEALKKEAEAFYAQAQEKAKRIMDEAEKEAKQMKDATAEREARLTHVHDEVVRKQKQFDANYDQAEKELRQRASELSEREKSAEKSQEDAAALIKAYSDKIEKLKQLAGGGY